MKKYPQLLFSKKYNQDNFSGEVIDLFAINDQKPSLGVIDENELIMFTCHFHHELAVHSKGQRYGVIHTVMYRSYDGGKSWGNGEHMPFVGYEASVSVIDGILYVQTHLPSNVLYGNKECLGILYRSEDKGKTWTKTELDSQLFGFDKEVATCANRNLVKLPDGSVMLLVNVDLYHSTFRMLSKDNGITWCAEKVHCNMDYNLERHPICEAFTYVTPSGRLLLVSRVDWSMIYDSNIPYSVEKAAWDTDHGDGMLLMESYDNGLTWQAVRGLGYRAMMYPGVCYIDSKKFILTYTVRELMEKTPYNHMGVQALIGMEKDDGTIEVDFDHDVLVIDDNTEDCSVCIGGYGLTNALPDGSFITPYSYTKDTPELLELYRSGMFKNDDIYYDWCLRSGLFGEKGPDMEWWQKSTDVWKKILISEYGTATKQSTSVTQVLRWKIDV